MNLWKKIMAGAMSATLLAASVNVCAEHTTLDSYAEEWENYTYSTEQQFGDVPVSHWAFDAINRVVSKGWFGGYPDGTFHPDEAITRAEALVVFMNFEGIQPQSVTSTSYSDVKASDWYAPYIEAGKELLPQKTTYNGETPFLPNQPVTREDVCYALIKIKGYEAKTVNADQSVLRMFSDSNSISNDLKSYVAVAVSNSLISGYPDGTIGAQDPLTRAEFATMLYRATYIGVQ